MQCLAEPAGQAWDCSFLVAAASDCGHIEILAIIDGHTRECLAVLVEHHIGSREVTNWLGTDGVPKHFNFYTSENAP